MPSRNPITGDLLQSKPYSKEYGDNYDKIFKTKKPVRGKFRWDDEAKKFIPIDEWLKKYPQTQSSRGPMFIVDNFEPYESPVSGQVINSRRQQEYDLKSSGCRRYEGFKTEKQEADKYRAETDQKLKSSMMETAQKTLYEIEHGYRGE